MQFEVDRTDFDRTRVAEPTTESLPTELQSGQIKPTVERFALATNNITHAGTADVLDCWGWFPTDDEAYHSLLAGCAAPNIGDVASMHQGAFA